MLCLAVIPWNSLARKKLDQEFAHIELLEKQNAELLEKNEELISKLSAIDELHRNDIRAIKAEYTEEIAFLKEQLRAWQRHEGIK